MPTVKKAMASMIQPVITNDVTLMLPPRELPKVSRRKAVTSLKVPDADEMYYSDNDKRTTEQKHFRSQQLRSTGSTPDFGSLV